MSKQTDPLTDERDMSIEALNSMREHLPRVRKKVLDTLVERADYGATDHELVELCSMIKDTVASARHDLCHREPPLVINSGKKRLTPSKRRATVWRINLDVLAKKRRVAVKARKSATIYGLEGAAYALYELDGNTYCFIRYGDKKAADDFVRTGGD